MADKRMYAVDRPVNLPDNVLVSDSMFKTGSYYNLPVNMKETYYLDQLPICKNRPSHNLGMEKNGMNTKAEQGVMTMDGLKQRQENILEKLKQIKEKLNNLSGSQKAFTTVNAQGSSNIASLKGGVIHDIVVSANPSNPPYFLLPIKKLLQPHLRILSLSSVHSSVSEVDPATLRLFREESLKERGEYDVAFTVLWKNQTTKSMMVNPLTQSAISGEANILRYISRMFPAVSSLHYELRGSFVGVSESDYWLDAIQTKLLHGSNKERQSVFKQLNAKLGTSKWVDGDSLGLCDVFYWSVILQLGSSKDLPSNVASWFKRIAQETGINID